MKFAPLAVIALSLSSAAFAAQSVELSSKIQVERTVTVAGKQRTVLADPKPFFPGDRLLITINYRNATGKPVSDFVVNNPVPAAVQFTGEASPGVLVSVDGGRSFGPLATLKVRKADGTLRAAQPIDVTHLRWVLAGAMAPGASGSVNFHGVVR